MELNPEAEDHAASAMACAMAVYDRSEPENDRVLNATMANFHATMAVYGLLVDVRAAFARMGMLT